MTDFWNNIQNAEFGNEASVEQNLVYPLLYALGYNNRDISPKHRIMFDKGTKSSRYEADFAVFYGSTHNQNTSLLVVEAKRPKKSLEDAKKQGESYAANIKAPFLLLTDGLNLEIWQLQPTRESECILKTSVKNLLSARGQIEACLSKEATSEYCSSLTHKNILLVAEDFDAYETAELNRTIKYQHAIERTLSKSNTINNKKESFSTEQLISDFPQGAIIFAHSGYGKTTLSHLLLRKAIEKRKVGEINQLSFDVPLPDLADTELPILEFMQQRIVAHHPNITHAYLKDLMRNQGAILLCDGFDRLSNIHQNKIKTSLKNLIRDYPKIQIFIFSRNSTKLELDLPELKLEPLSFDEQKEFFEVHSAQHLYWQRDTLSKLYDNPLLLERIIDYWKKEENLPKNLGELFRFWLEKLLCSDLKNNIENINREEALSILAKATIQNPINQIQALKILRKEGVNDQTFNELLLCDALQVSGSVIELQHEALADYLRALDIVSFDSEGEIIQALAAVPLEADSFFPILLMELLPSRNLQRVLWKRLANVGMSVYLNSLRYRADVSDKMLKETLEQRAFQYLEDIVDGLEFPLNGFFPQLQDVVTEHLIGKKNSEIAITGTYYSDYPVLSFAFYPIEENFEKKIFIGFPFKERYPIYSVELDGERYRVDNGHVFGINHLKDCLLEIIKERNLKGGKYWTSERLASRLRYIEEEYQLQLNAINSLDNLEETLKPHANKAVYSGYSPKELKFYIKDVLEDIAYLKQQGENTLDFWWLRLGWHENIYLLENNIIQQILNEHFRRLQLVYKEIIENNFKSVSEKFGFYNALPVRWDLAVIKAKNDCWINYQYTPAISWCEIGADVEFSDVTPERFRFIYSNANYLKINDMFAKLGRTNCSIRGGGGIMPNFNGHSLAGYFDGETTVLRELCELITNDIKNLFSELPSCYS